MASLVSLVLIIIRQINAGQLATPSPTASPTIFTSSPTGSPTFIIGHDVYVDSTIGQDIDLSPCSQSEPCQTLDWALQCLWNPQGEQGECELTYGGTYTLSGSVNMDAGDHNFLYPYFPLTWGGNEESQNFRFIGQGSSNTFLNIVSNEPSDPLTPWFDVTVSDSWLGLQDLALRGVRPTTTDIIMMVTKGTLYAKNVLFDGAAIQILMEQQAMFQFSGDTAYVVFEGCTFTNLDTMFSFLDGVNAQFIDCIFTQNSLLEGIYEGMVSSFMPMFLLQGPSTSVTFNGCVFDGNYFERYLFIINDGSELNLINTTISNNIGSTSAEFAGLSSFIIVPTQSMPYNQASINLSGCRIEYNSGFDNIMIFQAWSFANIVIDSTIFLKNYVVTDINFVVGNTFGTLSISDSSFTSSSQDWQNYTNSIHLSFLNLASASNMISNTVWNDYYLDGNIIHIEGANGDFLLDSIRIKNVIGRGVLHESTHTLQVYNSTFYNITKLYPSTGPFHGAGIYMSTYEATLIVNNTKFEQCTSINAGGIYFDYLSQDTILKELTFINNKATNIAADIYVNSVPNYNPDNAAISWPGPHIVHGSTSDKWANSIFMQANTYFDMTFDSWTFMNTSGAGTVIDLVGIGTKFYKNNVTNNQGSIIRFRLSDIETPTFDLQGNIFAHNYDVNYILDYVPAVCRSGCSVFIGRDPFNGQGNVFDGNDGGILEIAFNHTDNGIPDSQLRIESNIIRNYNNPGYALFTLSTNEGKSSCNSRADIIFTMHYITFEANIDTQLLDLTCFAASISSINFYSNTMPTLSIINAPIASTSIIELGRYSYGTFLSYVNSNDNQGIIIECVDTISLASNTVTNHKGVYLLYDNRQDYILEDASMIIQSSNFTNNNVTDSHIFDQYGLLTFYGYGINLYKTIPIFTGDLFNNNTGTLIYMKPNELSSNISRTDCPGGPEPWPYMMPNATFFIDTSFIHNFVDTGYLLYFQGVKVFNKVSTMKLQHNTCAYDTCIGLFDGWFTYWEFYTPPIADANLFTFGHEDGVSLNYAINLCFNTTQDPSTIAEYITTKNLENPQNNERITFLPLPCQDISYDASITISENSQYLSEVNKTNLNLITLLTYNEDGQNILNPNTTCDYGECEIICNGSVSCFGSTIQCNTDICNINCGNQYACTNAEIYSDQENGTSQMTVLCNGKASCSGETEMYVTDVDEFKLVCNGIDACDELTVNITGINDLSEIYCQTLSTLFLMFSTLIH